MLQSSYNLCDGERIILLSCRYAIISTDNFLYIFYQDLVLFSTFMNAVLSQGCFKISASRVGNTCYNFLTRTNLLIWLILSIKFWTPHFLVSSLLFRMNCSFSWAYMYIEYVALSKMMIKILWSTYPVLFLPKYYKCTEILHLPPISYGCNLLPTKSFFKIFNCSGNDISIQ